MEFLYLHAGSTLQIRPAGLNLLLLFPPLPLSLNVLYIEHIISCCRCHCPSLSFLFLHSPFHFVSASCSCLSALCYDLHIRALLFFVCEPNKLTSGAVRPGKGGSVEKLTAEKKKKVISRTPPGPHEWEKGRRDHRFQPCAVPDTVRQCVRLPSALGRGKWIANAIALGPEVCMYGGCASVMYVRLSLPFLCLTLKFF